MSIFPAASVIGRSSCAIVLITNTKCPYPKDERSAIYLNDLKTPREVNVMALGIRALSEYSKTSSQAARPVSPH
jgi:hypothetical protein